MKAVIMAGGQGTRLRPLTSNQPKPMIPIVGLPCMEHIVNLLNEHGFTDIVVTLQFMPEEIRDYFGDGSDWGVSMSYSVEDVPAGTAGSVKLAEELLKGERGLVISGDALTDCDLARVVSFHEENAAEATMVLKSVENPLDFGIVITEEDGRISRFLEKPAWGQVFSDTVNTGIYLLEPSVLAEIPTEGEYDFSQELFPKLLEDGRPLYGFVTEDYWEDIGTLEQYMGAQRDVLDGKMRNVRPPGTRLRENVYVGRRAQVDDEELEGPVVIGENVTSSLIYETMGLRTVFKGGIVSGKFNVDLTPEFTIRLASSLGTKLEPGVVVTLGRDSSRAAQVVKRAMTSALLGTGVNVRDLRAAHAGVVRHDVLAGKTEAGAHILGGGGPAR